MRKKITSLQYAVFLYEITRKGADVKNKLKEFLGILSKNNDLNLLPKIIKVFEAYEKKQNGIVDVEITSAQSPPREIRKQILNSINIKGELEVKEVLNPDLLAGFIVSLGDMMIDGSLKEKLKELNKTLIYG